MVGVTYPTVFNFFFCLLFKIAFRVVRVTFNKRYLFAYTPDQSFVQVNISFISDDQFSLFQIIIIIIAVIIIVIFLV